MSILYKQRRVRSFLRLTVVSVVSLPLNFVFPSLPPKTFSFPAYHQMSQKTAILDSFTVGSS